ncbi:hypothetical protein KUTeg_022212 [Tegillarca granosa]|uniref:Uncharacterized protein n=1 Tax=Tegillarca granosa TaxID=220873 RepID=A0ABQ9E5J9_TEGGR|nr:hypothetical protein KUTeg_022212 [Tegillarca granosa]
MTLKMAFADEQNKSENEINGDIEENNSQNNHNDPNINGDSFDLDSMVQQATEEYSDLNNTLDQLDTWMTNLEAQNDSLYSRLQDLLENNRQTRIEIQQENAKSQETHSSNQGDQESKQ